jgi:hypothetical protein
MGSFLEYFFRGKSYVLILTKTFQAIFSPNRFFTLPLIHTPCHHEPVTVTTQALLCV